MWACLPNGSGTALQATCGSTAGFVSQCVPLLHNAFCSCSDDWDCPPATRCEGGYCRGGGGPLECVVPPSQHTSMVVQEEIVWGGTQAVHTLPNNAFPLSNQVMMTPIVLNLDDDNLDGLINALDVPEIVFMTFCGSVYTSDGVLRAIHGGGTNQGGDYFATCGGLTWHEGDALPLDCPCSSAELYPGAGLAAGDMDGDGVPEIIAPLEGNRGFQMFSNRGDLIATVPTDDLGTYPHPALVNVDAAGFAELVVGRRVFSLTRDTGGTWALQDVWAGALTSSRVSCVADLDGNGLADIVSGSTAYRFPRAPAGALRRLDCTGSEVDADQVAWCNGVLPTLWDAGTVGIPSNTGLCAVADLLGVDAPGAPGPANPLDGTPEVALVSGGQLYVLDGATGLMLRTLASGESGGGAPAIADFDGDGFPEVGAAFSAGYVVFDFQDPAAQCPMWPSKPPSDAVMQSLVNPPRSPPASSCLTHEDCDVQAPGTTCSPATQQCVCLHNGWRRLTEDQASQITGSSAFDLNGDGAAEVLYNDECRLRVYDGRDSTVVLALANESGTLLEYPVVADVDNDGAAELVAPASNYSSACSEDPLNVNPAHRNGVLVWSDLNDTWGPARRIWNQHAYHTTNITESGAVPQREPEHWKQWNGRLFNLERGHPGVGRGAPDLVVANVQFTPEVGCGALGSAVAITVEVRNQGSAQSASGALVGFLGNWGAAGLTEPLYADAAATPLVGTLGVPVLPGGSAFVRALYNAANNTPLVLPNNVTVVLDGPNAEQECQEANNTSTLQVQGGNQTVDLRVAVGMAQQLPQCPTVVTTIFNDGASVASGVLVRFYAGDPDRGGYVLHDEVLAEPIPAGEQRTVTPVFQNFPQGRAVQLWAVVNPTRSSGECNGGNNQAGAPGSIQCP